MKKIVAILAACSLLFLLGCTGTIDTTPEPTKDTPSVSSAPEPAGTPAVSTLGINGKVTEVEYLKDGGVRILVESKAAANGYDKALVAVQTSIGDPEGKRPYGIVKGDVVEVVFDGPVAESYPVQAKAKSVVIVEYKELSGGTAGPSGAYYAVMQKLYEEDSGLNGEIEMIAIDLGKAGLSQYDRNELLTLAQSFGFTVLEDNFEGLQEKGYIKDLYFEKGLLFTFAQLEAAEDTLRIEASKWRSGLGAIGAQYTVSNKNGSWTVTETDGAWIS